MGGEECYEPCEEGYTFHEVPWLMDRAKGRRSERFRGEDEDASVESNEKAKLMRARTSTKANRWRKKKKKKKKTLLREM